VGDIVSTKVASNGYLMKGDFEVIQKRLVGRRWEYKLEGRTEWFRESQLSWK
jgi:hypothetical protein